MCVRAVLFLDWSESSRMSWVRVLLRPNSFYVHCCQSFLPLPPVLQRSLFWIQSLCGGPFSQNIGDLIQVPVSLLFTIERSTAIFTVSPLSLVYFFFFAKFKAFPLSLVSSSYTPCQGFLPTCPGDTYWVSEMCGLMSFIGSEQLTM